MIKNYILFLCITFSLVSFSQEVLTFNNYDGAGSTTSITATTSTVNDDITILLEDIDIINNFYTDGRTFTYIYGGLDTSSGNYQGAPADFFDNSSQPIANLVASDTDANVGPNTYSITINLASHYSSVPDGELILGYNLIFRNEFSANDGNANNQTLDLYIDLVDAVKAGTLNVSEVTAHNVITVFPNPTKSNWNIEAANNRKITSVNVFDVLGNRVLSMSNLTNKVEISTNDLSSGIYLARVHTDAGIKTIKLIKD